MLVLIATGRSVSGLLLRSLPTRQFPCLCIFPRYVNGVVKMQQQPLATVEKAKAEEVVVNERCQRSEQNVNRAEPHSAAAIGHNHLRAQRRVAIHVLNVVGECWVGMVDERAVLNPTRLAVDLYVLMDRAGLEPAPPAPEETQLRVRIKPAVLDPSSEKLILAGNPESGEFII